MLGGCAEIGKGTVKLEPANVWMPGRVDAASITFTEVNGGSGTIHHEGHDYRVWEGEFSKHFALGIGPIQYHVVILMDFPNQDAASSSHYVRIQGLVFQGMTEYVFAGVCQPIAKGLVGQLEASCSVTIAPIAYRIGIRGNTVAWVRAKDDDRHNLRENKGTAMIQLPATCGRDTKQTGRLILRRNGLQIINGQLQVGEHDDG